MSVFWIYTNGEFLEENVKAYYFHLKEHFVKSQKKECGKCVLTFSSKGTLKYHLLNDHQSCLKIGNKVQKLVDNSTQIQAPKGKTSSKPTVPYTVDKQFQAPIKVCVEKGKACIECDYEITEENHHRGLLKCAKCAYKTCCTRAMVNHSTCCLAGVILESSVRIELDNEMHCVCGFSNSDGNSLARHLATCGHKSAYISQQAAQENIVKKSMFEMLGLVRVEEDGAAGGVSGELSSGQGDGVSLNDDEGVDDQAGTVDHTRTVDDETDVSQLLDTVMNEPPAPDSSFGSQNLGVPMDTSDFMDSMMSDAGVSSQINQTMDDSGIMGTSDLPNLQADY